MCYIYCITNKLNDKKYVGKTSSTIEKRFKEHINESQRERSNNRPLYRAMRKYGAENFEVTLLEVCDVEVLSDREMFWIDKLDTLKNGYNATIGGDGKFLIDEKEVVSEYNILKRASLVAKKLNRDEGQICKILKRNGIVLENHPYDSGVINLPKTIEQYTKEGEFVRSFESVKDAALYLVKNGFAKTYNSGVRAHIADNANGKTNNAYGFIWKYSK